MAYNVQNALIQNLINSIIIPENMNIINEANNGLGGIAYDDTMTGEQLTNIAIEYMKIQDYDNMKICFALAIEKNYTSAMLHFARYYEQIEYNKDEIIRLYTLAYKNGNREGAYSLALYFKYLNDTPNVLKYLRIGAERFDDEEAMYDLVVYYISIKDEPNSFKYCQTLFNKNPLQGHFILGKTFKEYNKFSEMKIHFNEYLNKLTTNEIKFDTDLISSHEKQFSYILKIYMDNDINLTFVQSTLHRLNITTSKLLGHLQFKLNKTRLDGYLQENKECSICYDPNTNLNLFDCLGHHYCESCTINMDKCPVCQCTKKCGH
jgi:tetratricopeptide (TPR) repeat protein